MATESTEHENGYPSIQEAWVWPDKVERLFREQMEGKTLHVCCGESNLGDVTIDRDPDRQPDVVADMFNLPVPDCAFDTVIADPPWNAIQAVGKKHTVFFEVMKKLKPNGILLWNAYTLPSSDQAKLEKTWLRQDFEEGKVSAIGRYRRYPDQQTFDEL